MADKHTCRCVFRAGIPDGLTTPAYLTLIRTAQAGQYSDQCRFSAAIGASDPERFTIADLKIQISMASSMMGRQGCRFAALKSRIASLKG